MKTKAIFSIVTISILLSSCLVNSLHPFYYEEDAYFEENILGIWLDQDSTKWTFKKLYASYSKEGQKEEYRTKGYTVRYNPKHKMNTQEEPYSRIFVDFDVFLFKLNNQLYADFCPTMFPSFETMGAEFTKLHSVRTHTLAKMNIKGDDIELIWFNGQWLAELIENNRIKISHEFIPFSEPYSKQYKGQYVLTANTDELQNFINKYGNDPNAFVCKVEPIKRGFYRYNVGGDQISGTMGGGRDSVSYNYNLKKIEW